MISMVKGAVAAILLTGIISCHFKNEFRENEPEEEMDGVDLAMQQEFMMTRDPALNTVPRERLEIARQSLLNASTARLNALSWQERGPNNIGGRTRAILVDKRDATGNTVFAGSVGGGIFKTTNFLSATPNWAPVDDQLNNLAITVLVQDTANPTTMYAGTGEGWFNIDGIVGHGIYKSTDGGATWAVIPSTVATTATTFEYVQDLVIDKNGNLYASTRNLSSGIRGVQRSTDGGTTWTQVLGAPLTNPVTFLTGQAADLEVASNGDIYASLGLIASIYGRSVVLKSSFATNGANTGALGTWTNITPVRTTVTQRVEIATAPSDPQRVYLLMQDSTDLQVNAVYRSIDGGTTWDSLPAPSALNNGGSSQTWYNLIAAVDPNNANTLIVGGLNLAKSTDGGNSWTTITTSSTVHVDQHALVYNGSSQLYVGNDGGVYYSGNADAASPMFVNKNSGYNVTQFYACAIHPTNTNYFLAGAQDNNTQQFDMPGIDSTKPIVGGDGGFCHINQSNPQIQIAATTGNNYYLSTNGGTTFVTIGASNVNNRGQFINPTDYDAVSNTLYCGDDPGYYYVVSGFGGTITNRKNPLAILGSQEVTAVKVDPSGSGAVWLGASYGSAKPILVRVSSAGTASPTVDITSVITGSVGNASISSIDVDPNNTNHLLVTLSNYGVISVWEGLYDGVSTINWTNIEGNLPDMPVRWGMFAPASAQLNGTSGGNGGIILATELGVWTTSASNGSSTVWIANNSGLPNVRTDMLRYRSSDATLAAATHGRGLFTTTLPGVVTGVSNNTITKDFIKYISASANQLQIVKGTLNTQQMNIQVFDMKGSMVYKSSNRYENTIINTSRLQKGIYVVKISGNKQEYFVQQFVKN